MSKMSTFQKRKCQNIYNDAENEFIIGAPEIKNTTQQVRKMGFSGAPIIVIFL